MSADQDSPAPAPAPAAPGLFATVARGATLSDKVYERLRRAILIGVWAPGDKITARSLSREFGVSLTPVREAMMRLANEGALEVSETRAFLIPVLKRAQYREIVEIRLALEPLAAAAAVPAMTEQTIEALAGLKEQMLDMIRAERFNEALQRDSEFHLTLYDQANRPTLRGIIDSLWLRTGPTRNRLSYGFRKRLVGYQNNGRILAALRARDAAAVRGAVARDLSEGAAVILEVLED